MMYAQQHIVFPNPNTASPWIARCIFERIGIGKTGTYKKETAKKLERSIAAISADNAIQLLRFSLQR